jgi:zinc protease
MRPKYWQKNILVHGRKKEVKSERIKMPAFPKNTTVDFVDKPGAVQSVISLTYPVEFKPTAKDRIAVSLMNAHFGGYFSSMINLNLREDKGYTYGASSSLNFDKYVGSFSAGASVGTKVTESAIEEILKEMQKIRLEELTDEEFKLVKSVMAGQFARSLEQPQSLANYALSIARYGLPEDFYAKYLENLDKVTKLDIQQAAMNYIRPENTRILIVGNKKEIAQDLARFAHNKSVDFYDFYGNPIETDKLKVPANLTADKVIEDYLSAIGGRSKIEKINSMKQTGEASLGGFQITMQSVHQNPDKMAMSITAQGQELNSVVVNGDKAKVVNMGQPQILEGDDASDITSQAVIFEEILFFDENISLSISGIEIVEGRNAYAIEVSRNQGLPEIFYYDVETKLRLRSITYSKSADQVLTQTVDYSNYKEVDGIKWPYIKKISGGGMPMALTVELKEIVFNTEIDPKIFQIQ